MKNRNFDSWLGSFKTSINGYTYYTNFDNVYEKANKYKIEINILNSLVGAIDIEKQFEQIVERYPECLKALPILLAVRGYEIYCQDENGAVNYRFDEPIQTIDEYKYFMQKTNLFDMLQNHIISNLYDYVTGVEVGLNSNGRKNRGGHQMENLVEAYLKKAGVRYFREMYLEDIEKKWGLDLSSLSEKGTSTKRWDFVVKSENCVCGIETNFYSSHGSKLNEIARSYKLIAQESRNIENFKFIWITDGQGWLSARHNLREAFNEIPDIYNIADMEGGVFTSLFK